MQDQADRIECTLDYVEGANLTVEKLLAGDWDEMFWVVEPGETITQGRFFA